MGMFDTVECRYSEMPKEHQKLDYQTKSFHNAMDLYVIDKDGCLYHEDYDIEDKSDPNAEGLERLIGCMTKVNKRLVHLKDYTDTIFFYGFTKEKWVEYKVQYTEGTLTYFKELEANG